MTESGHQSKLEGAGNIGAALGRASNGLVTIDFDEDSYVDAFLAANPLLKTTLRTRASRGCNIWVRCSCEYPPSQRLKNVIGERRADGSQTIISGTHPDGMPYRFAVECPVITISYEAIIWPESILSPSATESNRVRRVRENKVVGGRSANASPSSIEGFISEDSISKLTPTDFHQNNASLFKLARLPSEYSMGRRATTQERKFVFDQWCQLAKRFWRHARDEYWAEFPEPIELALNRAKTLPLPEVTGFTDERVRLLVGICREMQQIVGTHSFFLPTLKLGQLLDVHWSSIARWLRALEPLGVIHLAPGEVRKRGAIRCLRYHYGKSLET